MLLKPYMRIALLGVVLTTLTGSRGEDFPFMCSAGIGMEAPRLAVTKSPLSLTGYVAEHGPLFSSTTIPVQIDDDSSSDYIKIEGSVAMLPGSLGKQQLTAFIAKDELGPSYVKISRSLINRDDASPDAPDQTFQSMTCWQPQQQ